MEEQNSVEVVTQIDKRMEQLKKEVEQMEKLYNFQQKSQKNYVSEEKSLANPNNQPRYKDLIKLSPPDSPSKVQFKAQPYKSDPKYLKTLENPPDPFDLYDKSVEEPICLVGVENMNIPPRFTWDSDWIYHSRDKQIIEESKKILFQFYQIA